MSAFSDLIARIRSVFFRRSEERELADELRFHVEMEEQYHRQHGASSDDAHRAAIIALGGVERVKEDVRDARGTRPFDDIRGDVAFAVRTLIHNPAFTLVAVLTLAVGIGGTTAMFSAVDSVLLQPLPYAQPGQLVRLYMDAVQEPDARGFVTPVHFADIRRDMSSFAAVAATRTYDETGADIGSGGDVRRIRLLPITADYFDVMRVQPQFGRGFTRADEEGDVASVVLSAKLWHEQFRGDVSLIGHAITMNGRPYTVLGVMPDGYADPVVSAVDAFVPIDMTPARDLSNADNHYLSVFARLRPTVSMAQAQAELTTLMTTLATRYPHTEDARAHIYSLKDDVVGPSSIILKILLGAVGLVLLLVCVNIANLLLVRGSERAREFAVRAALGAERSRLVRQMLVESIVLALAGDVAGLIVAKLSMSAIVAMGSATIPRLATLSLDPRLLAFSVVIATASALVFGLAPALHVARTQPNDVLRGETRATTGNARQVRVREWLVVSQVALAVVLLVGTGLLLASVERIRSLDLGVKTDNVLAFELHLPAARYDSTARANFYEEIAKKIEALPGVIAAGGVSRLPATGPYHVWGVNLLSGPRAGTKQANLPGQQRVIAGDYFQAAGIPLLAGRVFDASDDASAPHRVLISKALADFAFPGGSALGQQLQAGGRKVEIIGVVGNVAVDNEGRRGMFVYHSHRQFAGDRNWALAQVVATKGSVDVVQAEARRAIAAIDPALVMYKPMTLAEVVGQGSAQRVLTLRILIAFASVAIVLAALGLFGVLSYGVRLRTREFGIRMALGAQPAAIRVMVLRQGLAVTAFGVTVGIIVAIALARAMASVLFEVKATDPRVALGAMALMCAVGALAAYIPARRATSVDPRSALS
ncbi:MAG TPA: ABC transporter permease [Gemmatimonadaceae bacterium]